MLKVAGGGISGSLNYQGTWNASTNSPTLTSGVGTKGYYYVVSVAGTTNLNGITDWQIGDWAVFNGTAWQKVDNTDAVTSVNGKTGAVVLNAVDVGATPNTSFVVAGTGLSGGGQLTGNVTVNLANTAVSAASYGSATQVGTFTVDAQGRLTSAANSAINIAIANVSGGVRNTITILAGTGLSGGGNLSSNVTLNLANTAVAAGNYGTASSVGQFTVDAQGRLTTAANVAINIAVANVSGAVPNTVNVIAGTGLSGGGNLSSNVTLNLANTAVAAGNYGSATQVAAITIDAQGRITSASNVTVSGGGGGTGNVVSNVVTITSGTTISWSNATSVVLSWSNATSAIIAWSNAVYNATINNATMLVNYPSGAFSVVLPSAATVVGQQYRIKKIDSSANAVTVSTTSSQNIDGNLTYSLATIYKSVTVQSDGSNYYIFATT